MPIYTFNFKKANLKNGTASSIQQNKWLLFAALTFVLLLLLGNYLQLLCEIIDDLLFLQLLAC